MNFLNTDLPIIEVLNDLKKSLNQYNTCLLSAPPGAGKSTIIPIALLNESWLNNKKIIVLEPRRLAAKSVATRLAENLGEAVGNTVGYRIRFETKVSAKTKVEVVTEGILSKMILSDNLLEEVGCIIFDEYHERSIHADVSLALSRETQSVLRNELRILIMSATLDLTHISERLKAPIIESKGRQYPVTIHYTGTHDPKMIAELCSEAVLTALKKEKGDILVFLPGQSDIKKCQILLQNKVNAEIHPLFSHLSPSQQQRAIQPSKEGNRKIILATSIAETSLTIEGLGVVVDSGLIKNSVYDPNSGLSRLETQLISLDSAQQRAGRAGRLGLGVCYRVWNKTIEMQMKNHRTPEILTMELSGLALDLASMGIMDADELFWLDPPPKGSLAQAKDLLHSLGALEKNKITSHGKAMNNLPVQPRLSHMLLKAKELKSESLSADICAILEEKDVFYQQMGADINERVELLRKFRAGGKNHKMNKIAQVAEIYSKLLNVPVENGPVDDFVTGLLLSFAFPERIACAKTGNNSQFQLANGNIASFSHKDSLAHEPWLVVANLNVHNQDKGTIFLASKLNPTDLKNFVVQKENIFWDRKKGGIQATMDLRIGQIVLQSKSIPNPSEELKMEAIAQVIRKEGYHLLNFDEETTNWFNRLQSVRKWNPNLNLPNFSVSAFCSDCEKWLPMLAQNIKTEADLKKINLIEISRNLLDYNLLKSVDKIAPKEIVVPSGSKIPIEYFGNAETPVIAARLQECFGMMETPSVNLGKTKLIIHLLSPGYKPIQVTSDLANFWKNTYFEVKKELKGRYPKHYWPENPLEAEAVKGVKRK